MRKPKRNTLFILIILVLAYLSGPFFASVFEIGDRRGPKIYPAGLHEFIYMLVWDLTPHEENKPRLPAVWRAEYRPWFYGQYSKNTDPAWLKTEYQILQERLDRERANQRLQLTGDARDGE